MSSTDATTVDRAVAAIASSPQGRHIAAVFDFEGTVMSGFGGRRWPRRSDIGYRQLLRTIGSWAGQSPDELDERGQQAFRSRGYGHLYPEAWRLIRAHEAAGHTVVLVSSLTRFQVLPAAAELGVANVLYTTLAVGDGKLTGQVAGEPLRRSAKAAAVARFADSRGIDLRASYGYADTVADLPLLQLVGRPTAVNPHRSLALRAGQRGWPVLAFRPRPAARPGDLARMVGALSGLFGGATAGMVAHAPAAALLRSRGSGQQSRAAHRRMIDAMVTQAADGAFRLSGVGVQVVGSDNARAPRPAVYVFNHQSQFDMVVLPRVLRGGISAIVKKEAAANPAFGPLLRFTGATFIDRKDTAGSIAALAPVVQTLRAGISVVIAPEGTRSYSPQVGRFKKGAFHIARQAGVPVVPVVIRNSGEICWRNSMVVRPGDIDVAVLPPIDVSAWDPQDMDAEVEQVRQLFVTTLVNWPAADSPALQQNCLPTPLPALQDGPAAR